MSKSSQVRIARIQSEELEHEGPERMLSGYDGILVPGGFGERGVEGKIAAIRYAREKGVPFFGICLGMQCAVIEFARNACGLDGAHSTEFDKNTPHGVICLLDEQKAITDKGGTMRLGAQEARLDPESHSAKAYGATTVSERHRHRYELNNRYRQQFIANGLNIAGTSPDGQLAEIVELPGHRWFVAVQYHPEFKSKPTAAHPLFAGFIGAAVDHHAAKHGRAADAGGAPGTVEAKKPASRPTKLEA